MNLLRWGLAMSGWTALAAAILLPEAGALRVLVTTVFLLVCPGLAAARWARPTCGWTGRRTAVLDTAVLAVVLSMSLALLAAEVLFLSGAFTATRVFLVLAVVTSVLALLPRPGGRDHRAPQAGPEPGPSPVAAHPADPPAAGTP